MLVFLLVAGSCAACSSSGREGRHAFPIYVSTRHMEPQRQEDRHTYYYAQPQDGEVRTWRGPRGDRQMGGTMVALAGACVSM